MPEWKMDGNETEDSVLANLGICTIIKRDYKCVMSKSQTLTAITNLQILQVAFSCW